MVKSVERITRRFARGAIRAFLENKNSINWVLSMIESSGVRDRELSQIFQELREYGNPERYNEALPACQDRGWLE